MQDAGANLIPGAAESWTISEDGTVYTFKLRADAVWSNGDPVTADDFVYSFRRLEDPATGGRIRLDALRRQERRGGQRRQGEARGARRQGDRPQDARDHAQRRRRPYFLEMLTHQATYPVNRASIEKLGADWVKPGNLVSNGAFTLAEFVPNDHIKLVKNPKFHDAANVKLDAVNFYPDRGPLDGDQALRGGRTRFQRRPADRAARRPQGEVRRPGARSAPILGTYYYAVKWDKAPWSNVKLRRAISMAIDRDFLAEKVWGNTMIPAYCDGAAGHRRLHARRWRTTPRCRRSTARTRRRSSSPNSATGPTIR